MKKQIILFAALLLAVTPIWAQRVGDLFGGDLPQEYANDINNKFDLMRLEEMRNDPAVLERFASADQLELFLANAVVKVSFYPDGSYVAYALPGGEIQSIKLGRKSVKPGIETLESGDWLLRPGQFVAPKRSQSVTMRLAAAGTEISVECMNKFESSDETITFYVGPMNGLLCLGLVDEDALPFDEVLRTADTEVGRGAAAPGS